jgi:transcriptional regulator with XRE-family HTH domain
MRWKAKSRIDRDIGERLRAYRLAAGMSQTDAGNHLGRNLPADSEIREGR